MVLKSFLCSKRAIDEHCRRSISILENVMKVSARNALKGTVKSLVPGMVNTEVLIEIAPGFEVTAVITKASAERLGLAVGSSAYAVVKSSDVMVAVD